MIIRKILLALILTVLLSSCVNKSSEVNNIVTKEKKSREKSQIPKSLDALDKNSEDMYDFVLNKDWQKAEKQYDKIQNEFYTLSPYLIRDSLPGDYLMSLETSVKFLLEAVKNKNRIEALKEANNITSYMCDVADYFITDFPSNLRRVHVFTRNMEINVLQNDWESARDNFGKVNAYWPKVKEVLSQKSEQKVKEFEDSLDDFENLLDKKDAQKTLKHTQVMRDKTATLEKYYEN